PGWRRIHARRVTNLRIDEGVPRIAGNGGDGNRCRGPGVAAAIGSGNTKPTKVDAKRQENLDDDAPAHTRISALAATVSSTVRTPIQPSTVELTVAAKAEHRV